MKKSDAIDAEVVSIDVQTSAHLIENYKASCEFNDIRNQINKCINEVKDNYLKLGKLFIMVLKNNIISSLIIKALKNL